MASVSASMAQSPTMPLRNADEIRNESRLMSDQ